MVQIAYEYNVMLCYVMLCYVCVVLCCVMFFGRLRLKCDGTRAETRFRLSGETDESI